MSNFILTARSLWILNLYIGGKNDHIYLTTCFQI